MDPAERGDTLERLLAEYGERREAGEAVDPEDFVARHPAHADRLRAAIAALHATDALFPDPDLPEAVGPYRVLGELGRGGMGRILRAEHRDRPGEPVAIKLLHAGLEDHPRALERFRREGEALTRLRHPGIVAVHEVGVVGARPFLAMELVEGASLAARVRSGARPAGEAGVDDALRIVAACARALAAAHAAGVVHRDVNPRNILLRVDGDEPVLVDFGLARADDAPTLTATGDMLGTPACMSPEQARGERADARSDVWSLGAVLWELLAGRPPRAGEDTIAVLREAGARPLPRLRRVRPGVPRAVERVVVRATAHRAAWRYPDAASFADDLERVRRGEVPIARGPSLPERAHALWSTRRAAVVLVLSALVVSAVAWAAQSRETPAETAARAGRATDLAVTAWLDGDLDAMRAHLEEAADAAPADRLRPYYAGLLDDAFPEDADDPVVAALVDGERLLADGRGEDAARRFDVAWNLAPNTPVIMLALARAARAAGRTADAQRAYELVALHYGGAVALHEALAELYLVNGLPGDAVKASDAALGLAPERADLWRLAAEARRGAGDDDGAREAADEASRLEGAAR